MTTREGDTATVILSATVLALPMMDWSADVHNEFTILKTLAKMWLGKRVF